VELYNKGNYNSYEIAGKLGIDPEIINEIVERLIRLGIIQNKTWS
jgi:DNA-binding MarR family transcriptional regulator